MSESDPNRESMPVPPKPSGFRWFTAAAVTSSILLVAATFVMFFMLCKTYTEAQDEYTNAVKSCIGLKPSQCPSLGNYRFTDRIRSEGVQWGAMPHSTYVLRTEILDAIHLLHIDNGVIVGPIEEGEANRIEEELRKGSMDNKQ